MKTDFPNNPEVRRMLMAAVPENGWKRAVDVVASLRLPQKIVWPQLTALLLEGALTTHNPHRGPHGDEPAYVGRPGQGT